MRLRAGGGAGRRHGYRRDAQLSAGRAAGKERVRFRDERVKPKGERAHKDQGYEQNRRLLQPSHQAIVMSR